MITCSNCQKFKEPECTVYKREPPHSFALKCRHFIIVENYVPKDSPKERDCSGCYNNDDGWCLRLDHPDFKYNFVKINKGTDCPMEQN